MNTKTLPFILACFAFGAGAINATGAPAEPVLRRTITPADQARINALMEKMSVPEKVRQLCCFLADSGAVDRQKMIGVFGEDGMGTISTPATKLPPRQGAKAVLMIQGVATQNTRDGIPAFIAAEALHGLSVSGGACFPQAIGLGATWDVPLMEKIADRIGREARARGVNMVHSPVLNLARDPRHGRVEECYSEDPLLASRMGVAFVRGVQAHNVVCTVKHFVCNFVGPGGRDSGDIEFSDREMKEIYLPPFEAAVREGGALGIMAAYNSVNGIPCCANRHLLGGILRDEWEFNGVVVSDWGAVRQAYKHFHIAPDALAADRACLASGTDIDLPSGESYSQLGSEITDGSLDMNTLDAAVRHVLLTKAAIGLLDPGYKFADPAEAEKLGHDAEGRELPLAAARESVVLLKNKDHILPIASTVKSIAVMGPQADVLRLGGYSAPSARGPTPLAAIRARFGEKAEILTAKGCDLTGDKGEKGDKLIAEAVETAKKAGLCILCVGGEYEVTGGESQDRCTLDLMGRQEDLIRAVAATGKPVVVVLINGYPVTVANWINQGDALVCAWYGGSEGNTALAGILAGDVNPSGHLPVTFPRATGQLPMTYDMRPNGRGGRYAILNPGHPFDEKTMIEGNRYDPQYPFGFGLSYTTFQFSDLTVSPAKIAPGATTTVRVKVTNTGKREGATVAQLYLAADWQPIVPRERTLRDFQRVSLKPGESRVVSFKPGPKDFSFLDENLKRALAPGSFTVTVGEDCLAPLTAKAEVVSTTNR